MKRTLLIAMSVCAAALGTGVWAQAPGPSLLPLDNLGLEHLDIVVPDTAASARFYARIFKTKLHQQPVRDTLRYFVLLGDLPQDRQVGYIAIGAGQGRPASIGHYCVLAKTYNRDAFAGALDASGLPSKPTAAVPARRQSRCIPLAGPPANRRAARSSEACRAPAADANSS